ncbi:hypothetical protein [Sphingomonas sp. CCH10-B3]|uniref:hypothetical protein n=1 Tax=Sphingomonas sp. CCH10-B3 TaxID=1768757 RepID=UPI001454E40B|nr:hypothetical protein [Sphingomonas sp. CCH10-B3]
MQRSGGRRAVTRYDRRCIATSQTGHHAKQQIADRGIVDLVQIVENDARRRRCRQFTEQELQPRGCICRAEIAEIDDCPLAIGWRSDEAREERFTQTRRTGRKDKSSSAPGLIERHHQRRTRREDRGQRQLGGGDQQRRTRERTGPRRPLECRR